MALASIWAYLHCKWIFKQLNTYIPEVPNIPVVRNIPVKYVIIYAAVSKTSIAEYQGYKIDTLISTFDNISMVWLFQI